MDDDTIQWAENQMDSVFDKWAKGKISLYKHEGIIKSTVQYFN